MQRAFPHTANQKQKRKMHSGLCQGQATRLLVFCPAQRLASEGGRCIAVTNALKIGKFKPSFVDFHTLPTWYNAIKCIEASAKARRRSFWRVTWPNVWRQAKTLNLWVFLGSNSHSTLEVEGPGAPPPSLAPCALTGAQHSSSHSGFLPVFITYKPNNGGGTPTRTFVGMPRGCGFHPSNGDGWLICIILTSDLRFLLYYFTIFYGD